MVQNLQKEVKLSNGMTTLIDEEDFDKASELKWLCNNYGYAASTTKPKVLLHRLIMNPPKDKQIDHINHNRIDNRKSNLRICTNMENHRNTLKHKTNTSGYKGVSWNKYSGKWEARIRVNKRKLSLGYFTDLIEAAEAYDVAATLYFGEFKLLNKKVV